MGPQRHAREPDRRQRLVRLFFGVGQRFSLRLWVRVWVDVRVDQRLIKRVLRQQVEWLFLVLNVGFDVRLDLRKRLRKHEWFFKLGRRLGVSYRAVSLWFLRRRLLSTTLTLLNAIAALAMIGERSQPVNGKSTPAAIGTPMRL